MTLSVTELVLATLAVLVLLALFAAQRYRVAGANEALVISGARGSKVRDEKGDLVTIMKAMSIGMKVRCANCHVATDDLSEADFPSDEKPTKVAAREMLRTLFDTRAKYPPAAAPATGPVVAPNVGPVVAPVVVATWLLLTPREAGPLEPPPPEPPDDSPPPIRPP